MRRMIELSTGNMIHSAITIPFEYRMHFQDVMPAPGIEWLYGKKAADCIARLHSAVRMLGTVQDDDYQAATPGNAGYVLSTLLKWAKQHPEAVFRGD